MCVLGDGLVAFSGCIGSHDADGCKAVQTSTLAACRWGEKGRTEIAKALWPCWQLSRPVNIFKDCFIIQFENTMFYHRWLQLQCSNKSCLNGVLTDLNVLNVLNCFSVVSRLYQNKFSTPWLKHWHLLYIYFFFISVCPLCHSQWINFPL